MNILELINVVSPEVVKNTYNHIDDIFNVMFKNKKNKSITIRFNNVIKELQIGTLVGKGYRFNPIYTISNIVEIDKNIPIELHRNIVELHKYIDIIFNICFSSRKKIVYIGLYKKEQQMILNTRSNVKIKPSYVYDSLLYDT